MKPSRLASPSRARPRRAAVGVNVWAGLAGPVAALARLQSATAAELDALLPSVLDKANVDSVRSRSLRPAGVETTQPRLTAALAVRLKGER